MLQKNYELTNLNTLGVSVVAENYYRIDSLAQLDELSHCPIPHFYLGGGSNVLFTQNYGGTVVHNCLMGIENISESDEDVIVRVYAGESWHGFVTHALNEGWFGLECLAYIPGNVGATPVQNIGAYGVEARTFIEKVNVYNIQKKSYETYSNDECEFGYRNSAFKSSLKDRLVISVDFKLSKMAKKHQKFYPALQDYFDENFIDNPQPLDIYHAVIAVRRSKLPEVGEIGSAGSFFKNPIVTQEQLQKLKIKYPNLSSYEYSETHVKLAAGQLIDILGFKGKYENNVGMYEKQALILVNLGGASGEALYLHSMRVMKAVENEFGICLEPEVIIL